MTDTSRAKPLNIAHRGGADLWPENTLEAFARAIELGVDGIELDIHLSKDAKLVVHHDTTLRPDATRLGNKFLQNPTPRIDALSVDELQSYDVGTLKADSPYGRYRAMRANMDGLKIPTLTALETLIAETAPKGFRLYTELKTDMNAGDDEAHRLADAYLRHLDSAEIFDEVATSRELYLQQQKKVKQARLAEESARTRYEAAIAKAKIWGSTL